MNRVCLVGNMTADPEMRSTQSGIAQATFTVACKRRFKNKDTGEYESDFVRVKAWRNTAEYVGRYGAKGRKVSVDGVIQTGSYEDNEGKKHYTTDVIAEDIAFLDSKGTPQTQQTEQTASGNSQDGGFTQVEDDELPF